MRLQVEELVAGYGRVEILHGISIAVDKQRVGLFGPNGHGKTTLLRALSGLIRPTGGKVIFDGKDITGRSPQDLEGPIPEVYALDRRQPRSEDCLHVNVFTPNAGDGKRPVSGTRWCWATQNTPNPSSSAATTSSSVSWYSCRGSTPLVRSSR